MVWSHGQHLSGVLENIDTGTPLQVNFVHGAIIPLQIFISILSVSKKKLSLEGVLSFQKQYLEVDTSEKKSIKQYQTM